MKKIIPFLVASVFIFTPSIGWSEGIFCKFFGFSCTYSFEDLVIREGEYFKKFTTNKVSGKVEDFFENGQLYAIGSIVNGRKEGLWKTFYIKGRKFSEGAYESGLREGLWKELCEGGNLLKELTFNNGVLRYVSHYGCTGKILAQGQYDEDQKATGLWSHYHESGIVKKIGHYEGGEKIGKWKFFNLKGELFGEGKCAKGVMVGPWLYNKEIEDLKEFNNMVEFKLPLINKLGNGDFLDTLREDNARTTKSDEIDRSNLCIAQTHPELSHDRFFRRSE